MDPILISLNLYSLEVPHMNELHILYTTPRFSIQNLLNLRAVNQAKSIQLVVVELLTFAIGL